MENKEMSIINCPDCQKEMSDASPSCPNCGRPNENISHPQRSVGFLLGVGIFLFPLIFSWFTLRKGHTTTARIIAFIWLAISLALFAAQGDKKLHTTSSTSQDSSAEAVQEEQVMQVDIRQILADYENNEVAADNKYKGNIIHVNGIVDDIKKDIADNLYVTLGTGKQFEIPQIQAFFDDSMNQQLGALHKGQRLTVVCRVKGLMMNVLAQQCVIK